MAAEQNQRSLKIQISNKTRNITLKYHSFEETQSSSHPNPELPPGSSDSCCFSSNSNSESILGFLVYEAESFTLAIFALIPQGRPDEEPCLLLTLEVSPEKVHLGDLAKTRLRMSMFLDPPGADRTVASHCGFPIKGGGIVYLSAAPVKVTAIVSHDSAFLIDVELEGRSSSEEILEDLDEACRIL